MAYHSWTQQEAKRALELRDKAGMTYRLIAETLNEEFGTGRTRRRVNEAFNEGLIVSVLEGDPTTFDERTGGKFKKVMLKSGATRVEANQPFSEEEMAEMFDIDMADWYVTKRVTNHWAGNFQTKLWWAPNELNIVAGNWHEFLDEVQKASPFIPRHEEQFNISLSGLMYEMLLYDAHIGSKAWGPETGEDYDLYIALERYRKAFHYLLDHCPADAERILFVVGQDLFHFDTLIQGKGGATAKGTPQDVDTRWQKLFIAVSDLMQELVLEAADQANVDVIVQPGNHDKQTTFYLGRYLEAVFANDDRVRVDNTPKPRKYKRWGQALIGYAHGDEEKPKDLYRLMTEEEGTALWREWHLGHLHQEQCSEDGTMRIRTAPALAGTESWHNQKGYKSLPGARAYLWDKDSGIVRVEYFNVPISESSTDNQGEVLAG